MPQVLVLHSDRVATVTLNRPERLNAWTAVMEAELRQSLTALSEDEAVRCIVITGAGRGFCAGADLDDYAQSTDPAAALKPAPMAAGDDTQRYTYLLGIAKPVIAAINGAAAGIGFCLAMYCDIRFVAAGAKLTTAFARRGVVAEHGSAWMLPRLVGPMHAADLLMSGRVILAEEAERMGFARMLPADGFGEAVNHYARDIANLTSPRSQRIIKSQLSAAYRQTLEAAVRLSEQELALCGDTADFTEGFAHYIEKRRPNFTGR